MMCVVYVFELPEKNIWNAGGFFSRLMSKKKLIVVSELPGMIDKILIAIDLLCKLLLRFNLLVF